MNDVINAHVIPHGAIERCANYFMYSAGFPANRLLIALPFRCFVTSVPQFASPQSSLSPIVSPRCCGIDVNRKSPLVALDTRVSLGALLALDTRVSLGAKFALYIFVSCEAFSLLNVCVVVR